MNTHPIFVHFPIALLTIYCLMELIRWRKIAGQPYWFYGKALFVMLGGLGALAAYFTGGMAKTAVRLGLAPIGVDNFLAVIRLHETFAKFSVAIFGLIAAAYLIAWVNREWPLSKIPFGSWLVKYSDFILKAPIVITLAILGLLAITITGGLGGIVVYGPAADPFFGAVYHLMFQ